MSPLYRRTAPLAVALAGLTVLAACSSPAPAATRTAAVERVSMSPGISSTGSLSAAAEQNLGFAKGGQLTTVNVKVGDKVRAGQVLAAIDPVPAQQALAAQQAQLRAAKAQLERLDDSPGVDSAKDTLSQAKDVLDAVEHQVAEQDDADRVAIENVQRQLAADQMAAGGATDAQARAAANQRLLADQAALRTAQEKRSLDAASGRVSIENAQQSVTTARNSVDTSKSDRPHALDQQAALVAAARAAVAQAERDLANTTLRAPAAGTVTALNGAVGEYVAPSSGTSALAPGTDAAIPGASGSSSGSSVTAGAGGGGLAAGATSAARPGGNQFLVLSDVDQLQVVALFNESDAAALTEGQPVDITLDALPDVPLSGKVASVAPSGTAVSGVISYYVTVSLDSNDPRLKAGQTATVSIATDEKPDVLSVPSAAVHTARGKTAVTVVEGDEKRTVTFEAGAVNDGRTEVISGLRAGQRVALPTRTSQGGQS